MERLSEISEKTVVPISLVLVLMGAVFWLSQIHSRMDEIEQIENEYNGTIKHIDQRLSRIEGKLGVNLNSEMENDDDGSPNQIPTKPSPTLPASI